MAEHLLIATLLCFCLLTITSHAAHTHELLLCSYFSLFLHTLTCISCSRRGAWSICHGGDWSETAAQSCQAAASTRGRGPHSVPPTLGPPPACWPYLSSPPCSGGACSLLPCHAMPCPALPCPVLSCPVLSCPVLSCPVLPCPHVSVSLKHVAQCPQASA